MDSRVVVAGKVPLRRADGRRISVHEASRRYAPGCSGGPPSASVSPSRSSSDSSPGSVESPNCPVSSSGGSLAGFGALPPRGFLRDMLTSWAGFGVRRSLSGETRRALFDERADAFERVRRFGGGALKFRFAFERGGNVPQRI